MRGARPGDPAERALAYFVFCIWPVGDRYRMLLGPAGATWARSG